MALNNGAYVKATLRPLAFKVRLGRYEFYAGVVKRQKVKLTAPEEDGEAEFVDALMVDIGEHYRDVPKLPPSRVPSDKCPTWSPVATMNPTPDNGASDKQRQVKDFDVILVPATVRRVYDDGSIYAEITKTNGVTIAFLNLSPEAEWEFRDGAEE